MTPQTEDRLKLRQNGYDPIPCNGKIPHFKGWQSLFNASGEQIESWERFHPDHTNTSILAANTPALDLDILDLECVEAMEAHARDRFEERGYVLVRIGKSPKRAITFRTDAPFKKINLPLISPNNIDNGEKIELLCDGQQFVALGIHPDTQKPYSWHGGSPLTIRHDDLPYLNAEDAQRLVGELVKIAIAHGYKPVGKQQSNGQYSGGFISFEELVTAIHSGASLHDPVCKIAGKMAKDRIARGTCIEIVKGVYESAHQPRYADRWAECEKAINDIYDNEERKQREHPEAITFNNFLYLSPDNKFIFTPTGQLWTTATVNGRLPWIGGTKPSTILMRDHAVEQATWDPGKPKIIKHKLIIRAGWKHHDNATVFNLYDPPTVEPGNPDKAEPWIRHVKKVYGDDADHIINWLAHRVQFPGTKIQHALLLGGTQGIGKDTMLLPVVYAVGPWNIENITPAVMMGRFNGFLQCVILIISEARDLGDTNRPQFYEHMKDVIASTATPVHRIDEKNRSEFYTPNVCGVIITTNHKAGGIYLPAEDRRHFVAWSPLTLADFKDGYFQDIYNYYYSGGINHVAAHLLTRDLTNFDAEAPPPKTAAFMEIVHSGQSPEVADLIDALEKLGNPDVVTLDELIGSLGTADPEVISNLRRNKRMLPRWLEACGYIFVENNNHAKGLWKVSGKYQAIYGKTSCKFSDLEKKAWAKMGASKHQWE